MSEAPLRNAPHVPVRVWDLPTRLFHWALVILLPLLWWTVQTEQLEVHKLLGFGVGALLVFRLFWGIAGSATARFSNFVRGPRAVLKYLRDGKAAIGHNPLGALSIVAILGALATMVASGLFIADEDGLDSGPLASFVSYDAGRFAAHVHARAFDVLLILIFLHLTAVLAYFLGGENLIAPMVTGCKSIPAQDAPRMAGGRAAVPGAVLAFAVFAVLWMLDRGAAW